ncbi:MAG: tetratricopeptide repeat protein, partial [Gemmatimonadales bacterium]
LLAAAGEWEAAARQWRAAVVANDALVNAAGAALAQTPAAYHEAVLLLLRGGGPLPDAGSEAALPPLWVAADLLVRWDRAEEGWTLLAMVLPADEQRAALLVRRFGERARRSRGVGGRRARGAALEWLAERAPPHDAGRLRLQAAQAYGEAGDLEAARRLLDQVGVVSPDRPAQAARSMATLIGVLADAGQLDDAEQRYREWESRLPGDDVERLRHKLAWGRVLSGDLDRASAVLGDDSSVAALAVHGWIALYRGELADARRLFREAGPYVGLAGEVAGAGRMGDSSRRARLLVLLERVAVAALPDLGAGLLAAHRGDTLQAVDRLEAAADGLAPTGGRADVLVLAAELARDAADLGRAEMLLDRSLAADSAGPAAPGALYRLAEVHLEQGRVDAAIRELERLILTFPASAMVPPGRRLLDRARNRIPTP